MASPLLNAPDIPLHEPREDVDPELLALPDPPKTGRTLTLAVLAASALASLFMVFAVRRDVGYAFASGRTTDVGELRTATPSALAALENRPVAATGMVGAAGAIQYERPLQDDTFRALPVAGREDLWVEVRVPAGKENGRWEPPRTFSGRLVRFETAGPRHRGLSEAVGQATHRPIPGGAWLLVDGQGPENSRWAVALAALFLAFAGWNVLAMARLMRKVRG